jgi:hypothetical protein
MQALAMGAVTERAGAPARASAAVAEPAAQVAQQQRQEARVVRRLLLAAEVASFAAEVPLLATEVQQADPVATRQAQAARSAHRADQVERLQAGLPVDVRSAKDGQREGPKRWECC